MSWFTAGSQINPGAGVVLADTGPLVASSYTLSFLLAGSVLFTAVVEYRDAANASTLQSQSFPITAANPVHLSNLTFAIANDGERIRVINSGVIAGSVQASIFS